MAVTTGTILSSNAFASGICTISGYLIGSESALLVLVIEQGSGSLSNTVTVNGASLGSPLINPTSAGYTGMTAFLTTTPQSGSVVVTLANTTHNAAVAVVPLIGAATTSTLGTWAKPGDSVTASPSTGSITGVNSTGLFITFLNIANGTTTVSAESAGATTLADIIGGSSQGRLHVASAPGAASYTYAPTLSDGAYHVNIAGVYVNAAASFPVSIIPPYRRSFLGR